VKQERGEGGKDGGGEGGGIGYLDQVVKIFHWLAWHPCIFFMPFLRSFSTRPGQQTSEFICSNSAARHSLLLEQRLLYQSPRHPLHALHVHVCRGLLLEETATDLQAERVLVTFS